jgi:hypothetical protein
MLLREALKVLNSFVYSDLGGMEIVKRYPMEAEYEQAMEVITDAVESATKYYIHDESMEED